MNEIIHQQDEAGTFSDSHANMLRDHKKKFENEEKLPKFVEEINDPTPIRQNVHGYFQLGQNRKLNSAKLGTLLDLSNSWDMASVKDQKVYFYALTRMADELNKYPERGSSVERSSKPQRKNGEPKCFIEPIKIHCTPLSIPQRKSNDKWKRTQIKLGQNFECNTPFPFVFHCPR